MSVWPEVLGHRIDWRGPSPHRYPGVLRGGSRGLVVHIASGFYAGTIAWQLNTTTSDPTSSHWVVGRDGSIAQMLDTDDASWAQIAGNNTWHSVEFEGFGVDDGLHASHPGWESLTDAQLDAAAALLACGHQAFGWPLQVATSPAGRGLGHHSMGAPAWGHAACPGAPIINQKQAIVDRAAALLTPTPEDNDMLMQSYEIKPGVGNANTTVVALRLDGGFAKARKLTAAASFKAEFGVAKLRCAVHSAAGAWAVQEVLVDATKPAGSASLNVPADCDGISVYREPVDATDLCQVPVAMCVEIG